ncbi:hypothetical protein Nepgr_031808 [Nepenthes gracilis]|uniref:Uncharacterized protein n=1 Tax=Nepenthes gracilis TaxID=150966 RepID=A0AAD3TI17_NEPGR|nr:hypothetical protein Nepgr_031808 [Nepenthes gracilis]
MLLVGEGSQIHITSLSPVMEKDVLGYLSSLLKEISTFSASQFSNMSELLAGLHSSASTTSLMRHDQRGTAEDCPHVSSELDGTCQYAKSRRRQKSKPLNIRVPHS